MKIETIKTSDVKPYETNMEALVFGFLVTLEEGKLYRNYELARLFQTNVTTITRKLRSLEEKGLIKRDFLRNSNKRISLKALWQDALNTAQKS